MDDERYLDSDISPLSELVNHPHLPIGAVLLQNLPLFLAMGIESPLDQKLGNGAFGHAFKVSLGGESVLKLTRDPTEMQAAHRLRGRKSKRIVHVYDLWAVPGTFHGDWRGWYLIHREYLQPLTKRDKNLIESLFALYDDEGLDLVIPRSRKQHGMLNKWRGYIREFLSGDAAVSAESEDGVRFGATNLKREVERSMILLQQIGEAVDEMHKAGIDWEDIHSDNMLRNSAGHLVIGDIGWGLMHDSFEEEIPFLTIPIAQKYVKKLRTRRASRHSAQAEEAQRTVR